MSKKHEGTCHDCDCKEGKLHKPGCGMEYCPFCGGQLISCDCVYKHFYKKRFRPQKWVWDDESKTNGRFVGHPTSGLPKEIYEHGLPENLAFKWDIILDKKGRIPYIRYPYLCCRCGTKYPKMFRVPDKVWEKYVEPAKRNEVLCEPCFEKIKAMIDN